MKKVNLNFVSPLEYLFGGKSVRLEVTNWGQFKGAFQPFVDIIDYFQTFASPYKHQKYEVGFDGIKGDYAKDAAQPARGAVNILKGIRDLMLVVGMPLIKGIVGAVNRSNGIEEPKDSKHEVKANAAVLGLSFVIHALGTICKGAFQLATTPITWLVKMPLRYAMTKWKGHAGFGENEEVQELVKEGMRMEKEKAAMTEVPESSNVNQQLDRLSDIYNSKLTQGMALGQPMTQSEGLWISEINTNSYSRGNEPRTFTDLDKKYSIIKSTDTGAAKPATADDENTSTPFIQ